MECKDNQYNELIQLRKEVREHEKRIAEIEKNHSVQEYQYKTIMETLTEMKRDIIDLKSTPSKRWDLIVAGIISSIIAFIASVTLNK